MRLPHRPLLAVATAAVLAAGALSVVPSAAADAAGSSSLSSASASAAAATSSSECAATSSGTTPSLAVQNACGDHAMGSEVPASASASTTSVTPTTASSSSADSASGTTQAPHFTTDANTGSDVKGFDISGYQPTTDWASAVSDGYKFVFMKSTEGDNYVSADFDSQWVDAGKYGLLRGTYHFAQPTESSGAAQAEYFYDNGAAMSSTTPGTLPPVLDAENSGCDGLSQTYMVSWLSSFMSTLKALTGRTPIIYTYYSWWIDCTGNNKTLAAQYPLWMAYPTTASAPIFPSAWKTWTFWQDGTPPFSGGGDYDVFESSSVATLTASYGTYARAAGTDRYATSTSVAQQFVTAASTSKASVKPGQTVYIASGTTFPDALSGGAAAGKVDAPVLLVQSDWISGVVDDELLALKPKKIIILGGTSAIDPAVQAALARYTVSGSASAVTRIGGSDRYATSADVAADSFSAGVANAYVAVGTNWPDALSGAAAAASPTTSGPILLVQSNSIPSTIATALTRLKPKKITVFGGTSAIDAAVETELRQYTATKSASSVVRYGGPNRFSTSELIAAHLFASGVPVAYAASGTNFPDALAGAPLSALAGGAPVLLVNQSNLPPQTATALKAIEPKSLAVLGGANAVSSSVAAQLAKYVVH